MTLLKLKAGDAEDLETIAAFLQDAVVPMSEMALGRIYERVHCGVRFEDVTAVQLRGLDQQRRGDILSLLTMTVGEGVIDLVFAAGGQVRLEVDRIACHLEDLDEPWPTQWRPAHPDDAGDG